MNAETVFKFYRAYKLFFAGTYDFKKYQGKVRTPPLINQPERRFYYRIAQKLSDAQVHALFTTSFFFDPKAHVSALTSPEAFTRAVTFASRAENGTTLLEHELYELRKRLQDVDLDVWLYGEPIGTARSAIPECLQEVISGTLPLDLASLLFLIPQPKLQYHWKAFFAQSAALNFGAGPWITALERVDTLLYLQRPAWRFKAFHLARDFWTSLERPTLAPKEYEVEPALFED